MRQGQEANFSNVLDILVAQRQMGSPGWDATCIAWTTKGLVNPNGPLDDYVCYLLGGVQLSWWEGNLCE